ncbi:nitroreductase family deazaflavin-dependent oxidoreductase [Gordonia sp. Z-3]|jgi:deazaflavin-dependent oxidoreductase (nitroreductase family)|uniref:Nitroreductase family deazaflavin-dependent oxidoreductase n=2 Tax=Gordonia TaxID=2053 RepID=A0A9X3I4R6_9ACTN|nr:MULTISPECIES: nitroreductase family deazaflavin-dependent oxidoreductase [Gordonia]MAU83240.1 nitroreductase family deazaflavin-dependent oxidoreductase [Gordonia sp. (in: high G+C Gram-positive bacteria)]MAU83652.1 nitroreductase family deazaflavin-dependent oxidoreductase [Gordonia sp. (in: high G+C Gram-positive bacteria)]MCF3939120.1 nitroreductase family deazaflavin-dependent oxidoreductase [Gordonia tangerina]MCX2964977.1 nitroreductase family deazaflavin-dependent oxidoreductase [Gord
MKIPKAVARFNKKVTNPIQRQWAPRLAPWAMVEHVGRKSGKEYSIPVLAWVDDDRLSIVLTYGRHTDWVRNVQAANEFGLVRKSKHYKVVRPRIIPSDSPDVASGARIPARMFESVLIGTLVEG